MNKPSTGLLSPSTGPKAGKAGKFVSVDGLLQIFTKPRLGRDLGGSRLLITPKGRPGNRRYGLTIPSP